MRRQRKFTVSYQSCEPRRLLAGISFNANNEIFIGGTTGDDVGTVSISGTTLTANLTGFASQTFDLADVSAIRFNGGPGNDRFINNTSVPSFAYGAAGDDELYGGFGNDVLVGGQDTDLVSGREGDDLLRGGQTGLDRVFGGDGNDRLFGSQDVSEIRGGNGDDVIFGSPLADMIFGNDGHDRIYPGHGENTVRAGAGDDVVVGGKDKDTIFGEAGEDRIFGQGGGDEIDGGADDDTLLGGHGNDILLGGAGLDFMRGEIGNDTIDAGTGAAGGRDRLFGDQGIDNLIGGANNDFIDGGDADDIINAGAGNDVILGQAGNDTINAGDGNDLVTGGIGNDTINVGAGNDIVEFSGAYSAYTIEGANPLTVTHNNGPDGIDTVADAETFRFSDGDRDAESNTNPFERVTVRPIIVSNNNGSNTAEFFGSSSSEAEIKSMIDDIFAAAEIDVFWQAERTWNNTFANVGNGGSRPNSDLTQILNSGDLAGVGSSSNLVIDMYFVETSPGWGDTGENAANGLAQLGSAGVGIHIGDNLVDFAAGRQVVANVVAHEIAHNLGLEHTTATGNLMTPGGSGNQTTLTQRNTMVASNLSVPQ